MKRIVLAGGLLLLATLSVSAQEPQTAVAAYTGHAEERAYFPKNFIRGFADFEVAPSHNEPDQM